jgi:hypothetical protein
MEREPALVRLVERRRLRVTAAEHLAGPDEPAVDEHRVLRDVQAGLLDDLQRVRRERVG